jgi:hypothetical protein
VTSSVPTTSGNIVIRERSTVTRRWLICTTAETMEICGDGHKYMSIWSEPPSRDEPKNSKHK